MAHITSINKDTCNEIARATEKALEAMAQEMGLTVKVNGGKYSADGTYMPNITFSLPDAERKSWTIDIQFLRSNRSTLNPWLRAEDFEAEFTASGKTFILKSINLRSPKFAIEALCKNDGKMYKFTEDAVRSALKR